MIPKKHPGLEHCDSEVRFVTKLFGAWGTRERSDTSAGEAVKFRSISVNLNQPYRFQGTYRTVLSKHSSKGITNAFG